MSDLLARLQAALGDRYTIERELGAGGMGRVFVALERGLGRRVAIKVLPPDLAASVSIERFRREIQTAASLQHPHIVPVHAAGEADGLFYYTMPFIDGETLRSRLARDGQLPVPDAMQILRGVLDALSFAHRRGVVHRDIKPENVLLVDHHALVTDFGVAKALTQASESGGGALTTAGVALGTPAYMAPEQAVGDPGVDHRSDIYAAGVLAYEMLGGRPPFGGSAQQVLAAHITNRPDPVERVRSGVPVALASGVMRCLEKDPASRWQSADDLKRELDTIATASLSTPAVHPTRSWWKVGAAIAAAVLVLGGWLAWRRGREAGGPAPETTVVAVLPFGVRGSPEVSYLGEGMVSLLSTSLDGAGDMRSADPHAVLSIVGQGGGTLDPAGAAVVAGKLGAALYVLGEVVEVGGRVQINASLYDRPSRSARARGTVEGSAPQVFSLVDGLATQLLAQTSSGATARVTRVASVTTPSLAAYKAYLDGEASFRAGHADSAVTAFERAIALDTAFALAYYRLSVAAEWATEAALSGRAAEQAVQRSARLADHDRQLLKALLATRRGAAVEAEGLYRSILGSYPDDIEAWIQLGEVLFHYGPEQGRPVSDSRAAFERVLYFDPGYASAMVHLARIAAAEGNARAVDSLVTQISRFSPESDRDIEMKVLRAYATRDGAAQQRVLAELGHATEAMLTLPVWDVAVFVGDLPGAEAVARRLVDPTRSGEARAAGHVTLAYLALAGGHLNAARAELAAAAATDSVRALEYGTMLELSPFLNPDRAVLENARRGLERLNPAAIPENPAPTVYFSAHNGVHAAVRAYLLGLLNARLGDPRAAERYAADLAQMTAPATAASFPHDLSLEVRAASERSPAQALALLRATTRESWYEMHFASPIFSLVRGRYARAELEAAQGDVNQAIALYGAFEGFSGYDMAYAAPGHLRRGVLYERQGNREAASAEYAKVLKLWKDADPVFQPMLDSARAGLARVGGVTAR